MIRLRQDTSQMASAYSGTFGFWLLPLAMRDVPAPPFARPALRGDGLQNGVAVGAISAEPDIAVMRWRHRQMFCHRKRSSPK